MNPESFLRGMYAAGARGAMDAIGIHPYSHSQDPAPAGSFFRGLMASFKRIRDDAGDRKTPFWITEYGYHTASPTDGGVTEAEQARYVPEIIRQTIHDPDVDVALVHSLVNFDVDLTNYGNNFGLVWRNLDPKLALAPVERVVPPRLVVTKRPSSLRSKCPKPKRGKRKKRCKTGGSVTAKVWKAATIKVSLTAKRRRAFRISRHAAAGSTTTIPISAKIRRKPMKPGRYRLSVLAVDRFGNPSDLLRRTIRIR
jgi:hypothetical protein